MQKRRNSKRKINKKREMNDLNELKKGRKIESYKEEEEITNKRR